MAPGELTGSKVFWALPARPITYRVSVCPPAWFCLGLDIVIRGLVSPLSWEAGRRGTRGWVGEQIDWGVLLPVGSTPHDGRAV